MTLQPNPPRLHGLYDVLQVLRSHIITDDLDLAADLPEGVIGHTDTARFGDTLETRGDIHTVAKDVVIIDDDVTNVNADAKFDPSDLRRGSILLRHPGLHFNGTAYRVHGAGKLDQNAVTGRFDDASAMRGDSGVDNGLSDRLEPGQGALLISTHETAIAGDIRRQHSRQSPFHGLAGQKGPPDSKIYLVDKA